MCDILVANREITAEGNTIFGKNSDRSCNEPQYFVFIPSTDHGEEEVRCTYIPVKQVKHTKALLLSKPSWIWGAEMGVNEDGVCIGNEAVYSKETKKEPALLGMDLLRLGLERGATAKEALGVITDLLEQYGQGGNGSFDGEFYYDNSFVIADHEETWYLETAGKYWGAKKVRKALAASNHMMLGTPYFMHMETVTHAKEAGYDTQAPFDFAGCYMDWDRPNNISGFIRSSLGRHMLELPGTSFKVEDMMRGLRSHSTEDPWRKGDVSICKHAVGPSSESSSTNSFIAVLKPEELCMWGTGMSTPCMAPFQPFWLDAFSGKLVYAYEDQEKAMERWLKLEGLNRAMISGRIDEEGYRKELQVLQSSWILEAGKVPVSGRQKLCEDIAGQAEEFTDRWLLEAGGKQEIYTDTKIQEYWNRKNAVLGKDRRITY